MSIIIRNNWDFVYVEWFVIRSECSDRVSEIATNTLAAITASQGASCILEL